MNKRQEKKLRTLRRASLVQRARMILYRRHAGRMPRHVSHAALRARCFDVTLESALPTLLHNLYEPSPLMAFLGGDDPPPRPPMFLEDMEL